MTPEHGRIVVTQASLAGLTFSRQPAAGLPFFKQVTSKGKGPVYGIRPMFASSLALISATRSTNKQVYITHKELRHKDYRGGIMGLGS